MEFMTTGQIARKMNRHYSTVYQWITGKNRISPKVAKELHHATGVHFMAWLYPDKYPNPYFIGYSGIKLLQEKAMEQLNDALSKERVGT
jgi:DNA-binding transcriptional regulator YdaS (Cro superfamily)